MPTEYDVEQAEDHIPKGIEHKHVDGQMGEVGMNQSVGENAVPLVGVVVNGMGVEFQSVEQVAVAERHDGNPASDEYDD